jgi:hypothetical protein
VAKHDRGGSKADQSLQTSGSMAQVLGRMVGSRHIFLSGDIPYAERLEAGRARSLPQVRGAGPLAMLGSIQIVRINSSTKPEQSNTRHVRSESVPQDSYSPVFGLWVRSAAETLNAARKALDVLTSAGNDSAAPPIGVVRRLSTVPDGRGLVDFVESMITQELRGVDRSERSAAWFRFDPLLCSQRAKGAAPASVAG